jgi:hypothetical protein
LQSRAKSKKEMDMTTRTQKRDDWNISKVEFETMAIKEAESSDAEKVHEKKTN